MGDGSSAQVGGLCGACSAYTQEQMTATAKVVLLEMIRDCSFFTLIEIIVKVRYLRYLERADARLKEQRTNTAGPT